MQTAAQTKGVFCLEGLRDSDLRVTTPVRPILELLRTESKIDSIHRDCATQEEFEFYLRKWVLRKYDAYPILYLVSHGVQFGIHLGNWECDLDHLGALLKDKCKNRIIVFASCSTLDVNKHHLNRFLTETGALAICGYRVDVDWLKSAAFEMLLLSVMQGNEFSGHGAGAIARNAREVGKLFSELSFRIVTRQELPSK